MPDSQWCSYISVWMAHPHLSITVLHPIITSNKAVLCINVNMLYCSVIIVALVLMYCVIISFVLTFISGFSVPLVC